jgi:hypothetical protein
MAAGQGFKTFTTGEVLTAADVNGYLMQGVLVFASEAARNAAITSPEEGQFAFTKDNNSLWYYTGSAWAASGATGDIEGVTAGTGLTGGGTSGTVTLSLSTPVSATNGGTAQTTYATGDLLYASATDTLTKRTIGTTGQILTVSGGLPTWATPTASTSGLTKIASGTFANESSVAIDNVFSSTYRNYVAYLQVYAGTATDDFQMQFRYAGPTTQTTTYYGSGLVTQGVML